jgi:hypothetical protein
LPALLLLLLLWQAGALWFAAEAKDLSVMKEVLLQLSNLVGAVVHLRA